MRESNEGDNKKTEKAVSDKPLLAFLADEHLVMEVLTDVMGPEENPNLYNQDKVVEEFKNSQPNLTELAEEISFNKEEILLPGQQSDPQGDLAALLLFLAIIRQVEAKKVGLSPRINLFDSAERQSKIDLNKIRLEADKNRESIEKYAKSLPAVRKVADSILKRTERGDKNDMYLILHTMETALELLVKSTNAERETNELLSRIMKK